MPSECRTGLSYRALTNMGNWWRCSATPDELPQGLRVAVVSVPVGQGVLDVTFLNISPKGAAAAGRADGDAGDHGGRRGPGGAAARCRVSGACRHCGFALAGSDHYRSIPRHPGAGAIVLFIFVLPLSGATAGHAGGYRGAALNAGATARAWCAAPSAPVLLGNARLAALNLTRGQIMRRIVLPCAILATLLLAGNLLTNPLKNVCAGFAGHHRPDRRASGAGAAKPCAPPRSSTLMLLLRLAVRR